MQKKTRHPQKNSMFFDKTIKNQMLGLQIATKMIKVMAKFV